MIEQVRHLVNKRVTSPVYLIHWILNKCNARCSFCFIFTDDSRYDPSWWPSLEEIERVTKGFGPELYNVNLTGGEPFIRDDIAEIVRAYVLNAHIKSVQITTNGWFTERVERTVRRILNENQDLAVSITMSLDAIGPEHDHIRRLPGLFNHLVETFRALEALQADRLAVNFNVTVSTLNQDKLDEVYDFLTKTLHATSIGAIAVRGNPLDPTTKAFDINKYKAFARRIEEGLKCGELRGYRGFAGADLINAKNIIARRNISRTVETNEYISPCYAGQLMAVLHANGDVYPCEILSKKIGNLKEHEYSFVRLWADARRRELYKWIRDTNCHCSFECAWTLNTLYNPRYLPEVAKTYVQVKLGRLTRPGRTASTRVAAPSTLAKSATEESAHAESAA